MKDITGMTFDEITAERKRLYQRGGMILDGDRMVACPVNAENVADTKRYNELANVHGKARRK